MSKKTLDEAIVGRMEIEWWKESSRQAFIICASIMLEKGFAEEEVLDVLNDLYYAVSDEYGD